MTKTLDTDLFDELEVNADEEKQEEPEVDMTMPAYGSKEWSDYIMSKFEDGELFDGNPTCAGLRRVAENVLGSIVSSRPSQVWPSTDTNGPGRATVVFEVVINWMDSGEFRTFAEVSDVWHGNTDDLFLRPPCSDSKHQSGR